VTSEQLRKTIKATPFLPFVLKVADGQQIPIPHPDFIMHNTATPRTAVVTMQDGTIEILDLLLITGVMIPQPAPSS
jgi:hypothetical protein